MQRAAGRLLVRDMAFLRMMRDPADNRGDCKVGCTPLISLAAPCRGILAVKHQRLADDLIEQGGSVANGAVPGKAGSGER